MTSNINPNNIDGAYPVAGQDNNSQGFRTNFTNTSTNFQFAADEITALQNTAVLTASLANSQPVINNLQTSTLSNGYLQNMYETTLVLGPVGPGSVTINYALGSYQTLSTNGAISLAFSNFPASGAATVTLQVNVTSTAHTLQFPSAVSVNADGIQGLNTSTNTITFAAVGVYSFQFVTSDGGTTITINEVNKELQPFNASVETIASGNVSLATTTSIFTSSANVTGNLAAGASGQIKILTYGNTSTGNTLVTVTDAAWGSSNIANLHAVGSACTLQYVNSKWFCVGNNGVTFS